jgi:hypothetical protein
MIRIISAFGIKLPNINDIIYSGKIKHKSYPDMVFEKYPKIDYTKIIDEDKNSYVPCLFRHIKCKNPDKCRKHMVCEFMEDII